MLQKLSLPALLVFLIGLTAVLWFWGLGATQVEPEPAASPEIITDQASPSPVSRPTPTPPQPVVITFVGDMMFDRNIRSRAEETSYSFLLEEITPLWQGSDWIVGNLESPITNNDSVSQGSQVGSTNNFIFTTDPSMLEVLEPWPFVANLGNNHINNFGPEGIRSTEQHLDSAEIPYFGQTGQESTPSYTILEADELTIALVNYNQFIEGGSEQTLADLNELAEQTDLQLVYTHWGNEYQATARPVTVELAHQFVDAGADLIIGSHPHVIQNIEQYQGVEILYSLGNFVFDQYFNDQVQTGLVVTATIDPTSLEINTQTSEVWLEESTGQTRPLLDD